MSLCEVPQPDQELVEKYDELKTMFFMRLLTAFGKIQEAAAPYMKNVHHFHSEHGQATKDFVEDVMSKPEFQAVAKVAA